MVSRQCLTLRLNDNRTVVTVALRGSERELAWLSLRALFGVHGEVRGDSIAIEVDGFLSLTPPLRALCERYDLRLDLDPGITTLLRGVQELRRDLATAYAEVGSASQIDVSSRLEQGRFGRRLTDFQVRDVGRLLQLPHGANFSVPGAGKTAVTYATYEAERLAGRVGQLLVVGPLSAFDSWMSEAHECFAVVPDVGVFESRVGTRLEVLLINYERLAGQYATIVPWVSRMPTHIVLDEAHRMKRGWEGKWGAACLRLAHFGTRRDVLTGTPTPQGPEDLVALLDFLWPNVGRQRLPARGSLRRGGQEVVASVSEAIRPLYVRTRKAELGLQDPSFSAVRVTLTGLHQEIYHALRAEYAGRFNVSGADRITLARLGHVVMYLIEAATNPALLAAGSSNSDPVVFRHPPLEIPKQGRLMDLLRVIGEYEIPEKFKILARLVHQNASEGRKTLIWTNFVRNIATLERMFKIYCPAIVHGGIPVTVRGPDVRSRPAEIRRFREDSDCLLMIANPAAAGEGLSLHHVCHDAIYLDRTFNAGQYLQSLDRIHRLGLPETTETRITLLISAGTIDEAIDRRVRAKAERMGTMLDDPDLATMALPDEEEYGAPVEDEGDVKALLAHLIGNEGS